MTFKEVSHPKIYCNFLYLITKIILAEEYKLMASIVCLLDLNFFRRSLFLYTSLKVGDWVVTVQNNGQNNSILCPDH